MLMDLESKEFKIALKEIPKEYKMDEKKVFNISKVKNKVSTSKKEMSKQDSKKPKKKNINKKYKSKK